MENLSRKLFKSTEDYLVDKCGQELVNIALKTTDIVSGGISITNPSVELLVPWPFCLVCWHVKKYSKHTKRNSFHISCIRMMAPFTDRHTIGSWYVMPLDWHTICIFFFSVHFEWPRQQPTLPFDDDHHQHSNNATRVYLDLTPKYIMIGIELRRCFSNNTR